jgi:23S rRNA (adenine2503-C2)-methyltransferase
MGALMKILDRAESVDGATKYLFEMDDGLRVESVFLVMDHVGKDSLCVSSQVGCALACKFCSTGLVGYKRDLSTEEIVAQVDAVLDERSFTAGRRFDVKYMGMGEPLHNIEAVIASKKRLGERFPHFSFHLSTVAIPAKVRELADRAPDIGLQISLHAPTDELRTSIMPVNTAHPIAAVLDAGEYYAQRSPLPVTLNYCMMRGVNDGEEQARQLAELVRGRPLRVQLVNFNPHISIGYEPSTQAQIDMFIATMRAAGVPAHYGKQLGSGTGAGCGQLDADYGVGELRRRPVSVTVQTSAPGPAVGS